MINPRKKSRIIPKMRPYLDEFDLEVKKQIGDIAVLIIYPKGFRLK